MSYYDDWVEGGLFDVEQAHCKGTSKHARRNRNRRERVARVRRIAKAELGCRRCGKLPNEHRATGRCAGYLPPAPAVGPVLAK